MAEAIPRPQGANGICRHHGQLVLASCAVVAAPVALFALLLAWFGLIEPGLREAKFNRVHVGMTMPEVQRAMGSPRERYTRVTLGPGIGEQCRPPGYATGYEPNQSFEAVSTGAHEVWDYRQAKVIFGKDQRVLAKSGLFTFD